MGEYKLKSYIDDNGKDIITEWLNSLDSTTRKRIAIRLRRIENGNFGDHKQLNSSLYELRFDFGGGIRIYYTIENNTIILLINGGNKKTQTKDIQKANDIIKSLKGLSNE